MCVETQFEAEIENKDAELWWKITIAPNKSFFKGWVSFALQKLGFMKQKEYTYEDSLDITTEGDITTIRPKE